MPVLTARDNPKSQHSAVTVAQHTLCQHRLAQHVLQPNTLGTPVAAHTSGTIFGRKTLTPPAATCEALPQTARTTPHPVHMYTQTEIAAAHRPLVHTQVTNCLAIACEDPTHTAAADKHIQQASASTSPHCKQGCSSP